MDDIFKSSLIENYFPSIPDFPYLFQWQADTDMKTSYDTWIGILYSLPFASPKTLLPANTNIHHF